MIIKLKTIKDVEDFVEISNKYHDDIIIKQGKYAVDGKSILGIFSLNLLDYLDAVIDSDCRNSKIAFYNEIKKWKLRR